MVDGFKQIESLGELKELIKINKGNHGKVASNFFSMVDSLNDYIGYERLHGALRDEGLILVKNEETFFNCLYFLGEGESLEKLLQGLGEIQVPIIVEEQIGERTSEEEILRREERLNSAGFEFERENLQFAVDLEINRSMLEDFVRAQTAELHKEGLCFRLRGSSAMIQKEMIDLWQENLHLLDIPYYQRIVQDFNDAVCIMDEKDEIIATSWWENSGRSNQWRHTVVRPGYRGRNYGMSVLAFGYEYAAKEGYKRSLGWIDRDNIQSIEIHKKLGAKVNGRSCRQYILKK